MSSVTPRKNVHDSRSTSARSSANLTADEELVLECKAAYLSVVDDIKDTINSKKDLTFALHYSGRNPSLKVVDKYWTKNAERMTFDEFCLMCKQEPPANADDLLKAFQIVDQSGDGYISFNELKRFLTSRGERMTDAEFKKLTEEIDTNKDGKIDYSEFTAMVFSTAKKCRRHMFERLEKGGHVSRASPSLEKSSPRSLSGRLSPKDSPKGSKGSTANSMVSLRSEADDDIEYGTKPVPKSRQLSGDRKKADGDSPKPVPRKGTSSTTVAVRPSLTSLRLKLPTPKNLAQWTPLKTRGAFFVEENGNVASTHYTLNLRHDTEVWITIEPLASGLGTLPDVCVAVSREKTTAASNGRRVVMLTEQRDSKGKYYVRGDLTAGKYSVLPFTSGCRLRKRKRQPEAEKKLIEKGRDGKWMMTSAFKETLKQVFGMMDLDGNGLLSRDELSLYNLRTSGDPIGDEEWSVVEDNVELKNGELTLNGFLQLNQMEVEETNGDPDDLLVNVQSMGFNKTLMQDESCPFILEVHTEGDVDASITPRDTYLLSNSSLLQNILCDAYSSKGDGTTTRAHKDVHIFTYLSDVRAAVVVENKSKERVNLELDISQCRNVIVGSHSGTAMSERVMVPAGVTAVAVQAIPADETAEWAFLCTEKAK